MLLEAEQADRPGKDAFAMGALESFSTQRNSARYLNPVSNDQVIVEACFRSVQALPRLCVTNETPMRRSQMESKM